MSARVAPLLIIGSCALSVGCGGEEVESPPVNPSISNTQGGVEIPFEVSCTGPDDDMALLGDLCGISASNLDWFPTDAPAGMAMAIGPASGPLVLIFNRLEYEPAASQNVAGEIRYAAFVSLGGRADDAVDTLERWKQAEAVGAGTVVTELARFTACTGSWEARATLVWRSTTLDVAWIASQPC
jgi:hypothetical protein